MAQIGVIVPVYKSEKFLDRSIQSFLAQTFTDFHLLLIEDGSPDNSGAVCDKYAAMDSRIKVIHMPHVGVSAVRNEGVRYMLEDTDCQWIVFFDSDDWIHPQMLEQLLKAAIDFNMDVSISGYADVTDDTNPWGEEIAKPELWTPEDFYYHHFINATIPVAKLCRRECFVGKKYPEGLIHEDEFVTYQILFEQKQVVVILTPMYAYYYNPDSITKKPWTPERLDTWGAYEHQIQFFVDQGNLRLIQFRYRGYLENALVNLSEAEKYHDRKVSKQVSRLIRRKIRGVIRRGWKVGAWDFRLDYPILVQFYPVTTKLYRFIKEKKEM